MNSHIKTAYEYGVAEALKQAGYASFEDFEKDAAALKAAAGVGFPQAVSANMKAMDALARGVHPGTIMIRADRARALANALNEVGKVDQAERLIGAHRGLQSAVNKVQNYSDPGFGIQRELR